MILSLCEMELGTIERKSRPVLILYSSYLLALVGSRTAASVAKTIKQEHGQLRLSRPVLSIKFHELVMLNQTLYENQSKLII